MVNRRQHWPGLISAGGGAAGSAYQPRRLELHGTYCGHAGIRTPHNPAVLCSISERQLRLALMVRRCLRTQLAVATHSPNVSGGETNGDVSCGRSLESEPFRATRPEVTEVRTRNRQYWRGYFRSGMVLFRGSTARSGLAFIAMNCHNMELNIILWLFT